MPLTKVIQKYLSNLFVTIVQNGSSWTVYSKIIKNKKIKSKTTKNFEITVPNEIPQKMKNYLEEIQLEYNFTYIALFLDSMGQGAIYGVEAEDFVKNSVDLKNVSHIAIENSWSVYASFIDINWVKKIFSDVGLDFIYSPFVIQYMLIKKDKPKTRPTLYILNHQDSIAVSVFDGFTLKFGAFFRTTTDDNLSSGVDDDWENEEEIDSVENLVELDSIEDEDIGGVEDLEDLDKLDSLEDKDVDFEDVDEKNKDLDSFDDEDKEDLELFGRDVLVYKYLKTSLQEYYKNPIYESNFLDTVVIYDGFEISSELIDMIENELFMDLELHKIDLVEVINEVAIKEVFK